MLTQLPKQDRFVDIGVVLADIGAANKRIPFRADEPVYPCHRSSTAPVSTNMFAASVNGQNRLQQQGQALDHEGIDRRPYHDGFARCFRDARQGFEAIRAARQRLLDPDSLGSPMETQMPNIGVSGIVAALRAQPMRRVIDKRIGQAVECDGKHARAD